MGQTSWYGPQFTTRKADTISLLLPTPTLPYLQTSTLCLLHWFSTWCSRKHKPVIAGLHPSPHTEIRGWVDTNKQEKIWPDLSRSGLFLIGFHWRPRNPMQSPLSISPQCEDFPVSPHHLWAGPLLHMFLTFYLLFIPSVKRGLPKWPIHWL